MILYNAFHAGDCILSRSIIKEIQQANPEVEFVLQCQPQYAYLWQDLGHVEEVPAQPEGINLWFATFGDALSQGLTFANQVDTFNRQADPAGLHPVQWDGSRRFVELPARTIRAQTPAVLVENGAVLSGQPALDVNRHLATISEAFPSVSFYCASPPTHDRDNLIDVSDRDLCDLSTLSNQCAALIVRLAGVMVCSFTEHNRGKRRIVYGSPLGCPIWDEDGVVYEDAPSAVIDRLREVL